NRTYKIQNSSVLQSVQLAQFSTNPHIVRAVFTLGKSTDLGKFKTYTNGTDIIVKYAPQVINNSLQYKFYTPTGDTGVGSGVHQTSAVVTYNNTGETKEYLPLFKTKYYLSQISQNSDGLILRGIGTVAYQKATYSPDNTKASFFLDNSSMTSKLDGKTFRIPSSQVGIQATLTVNRVNSKKIKLTIDGQNVRDYRFVISPDGQSLFISHRNYIINTIFSANPALVKQYKAQTTQTGYKLIEMFFDKSVAYDIFELNDNLYLDVNNLGDYNQALFDEMLTTTDIKVQAIKISSDKTRFIIPSSSLSFAYANVESNAKSIKLVFKDKPIIATEPKKEEPIVIIPPVDVEEKISSITEKIKEKTVDKINEKISEKINEKVIYVPKGDVPKVEKPKKPKEKPTISSMKKVVIDPGHGGADSGAIGGGVYEKTINLDVAKRVQEILIKKNVYVYMTRSKDETLTLEDRVNYSNEINPNLYVSIHTNSTVKEDSYGLETHYFKDDSYKLAQVIHKNFASERNIKKWETLDRGVIKSRFYVINHTEAPSVLIEIGFISNLEERSKLLKKGRREDIAESIADGILEYLKIR
ncbi:MAG: N-acetylmuramoyl-L-alanine amidase, partial [Candidatus Gastranaerophilales bacterium]|nr:N-acetylmuramoyl-L-alanine amidase [Candidatus Gastranaerophilales bacterium]